MHQGGRDPDAPRAENVLKRKVADVKRVDRSDIGPFERPPEESPIGFLRTLDRRDYDEVEVLRQTKVLQEFRKIRGGV